MNYRLYLIGVVFCFFSFTTLCATSPAVGMAQEEEALEVRYSSDLYHLVMDWIVEYQALTPTAIQANELTDAFASDNKHLSFVSDETINSLAQGSHWKVVVGHDAIVPIINSNNPLLQEIGVQGLTAEKLALLFKESAEQNWATLLDDVPNHPLHFYLCDDGSIVQRLGNFIHSEPDLINARRVLSSEELIAAVQKDKYAIGFCRLNEIRQVDANEWIENISLAPIDKNGNRRIDNFEDVYSTPSALARGVWIGKYPSALSGNIYAVTAQKPVDESTVQFLTWVLSEGGQLLSEYGYSDLASAEKRAYIDLVVQPEHMLAQTVAQETSNKWWVVLLGLLAGAIVLIYLLAQLVMPRSTSAGADIHSSSVLNENTIVAPKGLYFDKTHTWSFIEKNGLVRIGIDDFMQHITGEITRVMLKRPGEKVEKGEKLLTISCVGKQLTIYSPITGVIKQENQQLLSHSTLINSSPYNEGWVYLIEPLNWFREIQCMLMADSYKAWLKAEFMRLKTFLSYAARSNTAVYQHIILQDGGELHDHVLADLDPEVWEEFQTKFIDKV
ncbi:MULTISPECIES: hypothetical protein [unclassified Carboxylicivirga]|uniref:hypothetical protein n=1 Tax=Carboxylicivirga TaxID=1628153 RepID=UPI003D340340